MKAFDHSLEKHTGDDDKVRVLSPFCRTPHQQEYQTGLKFLGVLTMAKQMFVNLHVKDLSRSIAFFTELGFAFNPVFTDENATCMIIDDNINVMLLSEKFFRDFIPGREIADTSKSAEAITAFSLENREEVDELLGKAIAAGGKEYRETMDMDWMYVRAFLDPDGHIWEVFFMDEAQMPEEMKKKAA